MSICDCMHCCCLRPITESFQSFPRSPQEKSQNAYQNRAILWKLLGCQNLVTKNENCSVWMDAVNRNSKWYGINFTVNPFPWTVNVQLVYLMLCFYPFSICKIAGHFSSNRKCDKIVLNLLAHKVHKKMGESFFRRPAQRKNVDAFGNGLIHKIVVGDLQNDEKRLQFCLYVSGLRVIQMRQH